MAFPTTFRELQDEIYPRWAQRPRWATFLSAFSQKKDELVDRLAGAIDARLVDRCPDDALEAVGSNFGLARALRDTAATYRAYLRRPFERWGKSGTVGEASFAGLLGEMAHLGYPNCQVITWRNLADSGRPLAFGGFTSAWYLLIKPPHPWAPAGEWDGGARWDEAPFTWDSTAKVAEIDEIRRVIATHGPAGTTCRYIEVWLRVTLFGFPTNIVRWPCHESWERQANGGYPNFYNDGHGG